MPYASIAELPPAVRSRYSERCQRVFMSAFNRATGDEASRFRIAHTAAANCTESGKAMIELKAEPMTTSQMDRWLAGKMPRRILVAPFGGPLSKAGLDLDGEYFDARTDFYGPYPALRESRERLVDFHHSTFMDVDRHPAVQAVKGAIMGRVILDDHFEEPDWGFAGLWGDFWANAGEKRRALIASLEQQGHQLYGSTQPIPAGVRRGKAGHIDVWPIQYHTISTSPQNTYAIVPPLKAVLDAPGEVSVAALRAFMAGLDALGNPPSPSAMGDDGAKAGRVFSRRNEGDLQAALDELTERIDAIRAFLAERQTPPKEESIP
jgi:cation transport regulator ChaB